MMPLDVTSLLLLFALQGAVVVVGLKNQEHLWYYTFMDSAYNSTNSSVCSLELYPEFIERGKYAASGSVFSNVVLDEGTSVEMKMYRSPTYSKNFKFLPYGLPKQTFPHFIRNFFSTNIFQSFKECTPNVETIEIFFKPFRYEIKRCIFSTENFPSVMEPGMYRALLIVTGQCELYLDMYLLIELNEKYV